jgi:MFS family permease
VGTIALQWPLGWISDKKSRRLAILWSIGVSAGAAALIAMFHAGGGMLYVLIFLYGGFGMPLYSLSVALANDQFEPHEMVRAAGAIVIYYGIGNVLGPVLGSQFMRWIGPAGLFLFMTLVLASFLAFVLVRIALIPALPKRATPYRLYPRTSSFAFQMLRKVRDRREYAGRPGGYMKQNKNRLSET